MGPLLQSTMKQNQVDYVKNLLVLFLFVVNYYFAPDLIIQLGLVRHQAHICCLCSPLN